MNNITISQPEKITLAEGLKVEFKTSVFYEPGGQNPGLKQMRTIAETVASFMNAEGGTLYIGVSDDGTIRGIDGDLDVLAFQSSSVALKQPAMNDSEFTYRATRDHYQLKLQHIFQAFLSPNHAKYVESIGFGHMTKTSKEWCCRIVVNKCGEDDFVYCNEKYGATKPVVEEIFVRIGNEKKRLEGRARDEFVRDRVMAGFNVQMEAVRAAVAAAGDGTGYAAVMDSVQELLARLDSRRIVGADVVVTGVHPLDEEHLKPMSKPKVVVFDGAHLCDVKSWKEVFQAIYCKLDEISPASFDSLPKDEPKHFKRGKRCTGCYTNKFGTAKDVRAVELSGKAYLWNENYFLRKLMLACGVDVSRFMIRA